MLQVKQVRLTKINREQSLRKTPRERGAETLLHPRAPKQENTANDIDANHQQHHDDDQVFATRRPQRVCKPFIFCLIIILGQDGNNGHDDAETQSF